VRLRSFRIPVLAIGLGLAAPACGGATQTPPAPTTTTTASLSCAKVAGTRVAVVVEPASGNVISRCLDVGAGGVSGVAALEQAGIEVGTQRFSFGLGVCQVDNVPAHYVSCLPSGKPYWALFVAHGSGGWRPASTGISDITLKAGDSLGLRYDSPKGNPAAPSVSPPVS
jgi:hypothetical protein